MATALAFVAAEALLEIRPAPSSTGADLTWPGDRGSGTALLQVVAGSVMTVTSLTFSLVIVTFQLASQQFSPRLLRELARDRVTKLVLAILTATFIFALTVLRGLEPDEPLPSVAILVAFLLGVTSVGALLGFLTHIARVVRVDSMMLSVHAGTTRVIDTFYPPHGATEPPVPDGSVQPPPHSHPVPAHKSGFVTRVDVAALVAGAAAGSGHVWVDARPGDHVVSGSLLARTWKVGGPDLGCDDLAEVVRGALRITYERTLDQDASFGFRQLADIAVKALSPGINDPVTAAHAIGHMGDLLVRLMGKRLGPTLHETPDGKGRVVVQDRDIRYYLDLACGQVRRYGRREPTVLVAILRMLRDAATAARDDEQRGELRRQVDLVLEEMAGGLVEADAESVRDAARRVDLAIRGCLVESFVDRSGETRSI